MDQKDIRRAARTLVHEYGDDATAHARRRMQETISRRDVEGAGIWRRILRALRELQSAGGTRKR